MERCYRLANGQCGLSDGSREGDWRLPNIKEMISLFSYNYDEKSPPLKEGHPFTINLTDPINYPVNYDDRIYGTSTSYAPSPETHVWGITTDYGRTMTEWPKTVEVSYLLGIQNTPFYVWPVRGGMYGQ